MPKADAFHPGTVRQNAKGYWWRGDGASWNPLGNHSQPNGRPTIKRTERNRLSLRRATATGMIKVFYNTPESCNRITASCRPVEPPPRHGWAVSNRLDPYSPKHRFRQIVEYMGPLSSMNTMVRYLEAHFMRQLRHGHVSAYELQATSMLEKYQGWDLVPTK
jgi:hypothetical protein